jgi:hypothetical protein
MLKALFSKKKDRYEYINNKTYQNNTSLFEY